MARKTATQRAKKQVVAVARREATRFNSFPRPKQVAKRFGAAKRSGLSNRLAQSAALSAGGGSGG